jgi:hypothetical protein
MNHRERENAERRLRYSRDLKLRKATRARAAASYARRKLKKGSRQ